MTRLSMLTALTLALVGSTAKADCPNGNCPAPQRNSYFNFRATRSPLRSLPTQTARPAKASTIDEIERLYEEDTDGELHRVFSTERLNVEASHNGGVISLQAYCKVQGTVVATAKVDPRTHALVWLEVVPERRREGFATELYRGLCAHYGTLSVNASTPEGKAWAASLGAPAATYTPAAPAVRHAPAAKHQRLRWLRPVKALRSRRSCG